MTDKFLLYAIPIILLGILLVYYIPKNSNLEKATPVPSASINSAAPNTIPTTPIVNQQKPPKEKTLPPTPNSSSPEIIEVIPASPNEDETLKTFRVPMFGFERFEFKYPAKLKLTREKEKITLSHSVPFENGGPCDMVMPNPPGPFSTLEDFGISFEVVNQIKMPAPADGTYEVGMLKGLWGINGAEGCGSRDYYFPIFGDKTLIIKRASIQIFVIRGEEAERLRKVSGVITPEANDALFKEILSSIIYWKKYD